MGTVNTANQTTEKTINTAAHIISRAYDITMDHNNDSRIEENGKRTLRDSYLKPGESYQDLFARVASDCASSADHAQRIYEYMSKLWFMPATPILYNAGISGSGGLISCFLNSVGDNLKSIVGIFTENIWLASKGGGIGTSWSDVRSLGERVGINGKSSGIVPFLKIQDSLVSGISQGNLRRGSAAAYLNISHPDVEEFIEIRRPTGGDINRRTLNLHHGIIINDAFMEAVIFDKVWDLISPMDGQVVRQVKARDLWVRLLTARIEMGEPYILFIDRVNDNLPDVYQALGNKVSTSNLCSEITLATGQDHLGKLRTAVCCLSSLNLERFDEWKNVDGFIYDIMKFLDNVLTNFIKDSENADGFENAVYSASRERSVGLGVMGFHSFLQQKMVPFESVMAEVWNNKIFGFIREELDKASYRLAEERGPCPDAIEAKERGLTTIADLKNGKAQHSMERDTPRNLRLHVRFSNDTAIAPTAKISAITGSSAGIEPYPSNAYVQKNLSGSIIQKNKYLMAYLQSIGMNNEEVWLSIVNNEGSVMHLDFIPNDVKQVFKTGFEIKQKSLIKLAAQRQKYISQAQSLNLFLPANVHKKDLHHLHMYAWMIGKQEDAGFIKSLYYTFSKSLQRADKISTDPDKNMRQLEIPLSAQSLAAGAFAGLDMGGGVRGAASADNGDQDGYKYDECSSCQ